MTDALHFDPATHRYTVAGVHVPHITGILQGEGFLDYSSVPPDRLEVARQRGSAVHLCCALLDQGRLDWASVRPAWDWYVVAYEAFLADNPVRIHPDFIERPLHHRVFGFAGTPDRAMWWRGEPAVLELKATFAMQPATAVQTAAQALLLEAAGFKPTRRFALKLNGDGRYQLTEHRDPSDARVFLGALAAHVWKRRHLTKEAA